MTKNAQNPDQQHGQQRPDAGPVRSSNNVSRSGKQQQGVPPIKAQGTLPASPKPQQTAPPQRIRGFALKPRPLPRSQGPQIGFWVEIKQTFSQLIQLFASSSVLPPVHSDPPQAQSSVPNRAERSASPQIDLSSNSQISDPGNQKLEGGQPSSVPASPALALLLPTTSQIARGNTRPASALRSRETAYPVQVEPAQEIENGEYQEEGNQSCDEGALEAFQEEIQKNKKLSISYAEVFYTRVLAISALMLAISAIAITFKAPTSLTIPIGLLFSGLILVFLLGFLISMLVLSNPRDRVESELKECLKQKQKELLQTERRLKQMEQRRKVMQHHKPAESSDDPHSQNVASGQQPERPSPLPVRPAKLPLPPPSIYDNPKDPPDFEQEKALFPHEKFYPRQNCDLAVLRHGWRIIGASRRGYGHAYFAKYREDDFAIKIFRFSAQEKVVNPNGTKEQCPDMDVALVAIADGLSAKEYSRYGAQAAVQGATNLQTFADADSQHPLPMKERLWPLVKCLMQDPASKDCQNLAWEFLYDSLRSAMEQVTRCANEKKLGIDDLHSTLLVFLAVPLDSQRLFVASVQVGDGVLFSLEDSTSPILSKRWHWLQHAQIQETGNEVQPFMRSKPEAWEQKFHCSILTPAIFVMGMTDGTADDIEPPRPTPEMPEPDEFLYVDSFYQYIKRRVLNNSEPAKALNEFLTYKKAQSYDDRTVICLYAESQH